MINKKIFWSLKISFIIFGIIALYQIIPYFTTLLNILTDLIRTTNATSEFKIILICLSIYITILIFNLIVNTIFKILEMLEKLQDS